MFTFCYSDVSLHTLTLEYFIQQPRRKNAAVDLFQITEGQVGVSVLYS